MPALYAYHAMGGVLHSELELPELIPAAGQAADWTFRVRRIEPPVHGMTALGERHLGTEVYRLFEIPNGFRLQYSHAGTFDITALGTDIVWYPSADHQVELARWILLGPALAIALETAGLFCLHGSAVAIANEAVAFIGGKHHGKSTLAIALTAAGARLVSDDIVAIAAGSPPMARPGVASARLWSDSASELAVERCAARILPGIKSTLIGFGEHALQLAPLPLAGIYLLDPDPTSTMSVACTRERLTGVDSVVILAQQTKLPDSLVGLRRAGARLSSAAGLAASVPVWMLHFVGGFDRLHEVVARLLAWHAESTPSAQKAAS